MTTPDAPDGEPVVEHVPDTPPAAGAEPAMPPASASQPAYATSPPKPDTWMNVVSLVTALLGLAIIPVVLGHLGMRAANRGTANLKALGLVGAILGYLELVGWVVIWIVAIASFAARS